ncbi:C39 family peptidase [Streptomyces sp. NBC_00237]|uniref:C39 family peptidase n=1 Tax=Streptomyces sp. NBC_00237 TaxID=2975687 RepID=UPI00225A73A3|nr:C39 family peptidase [Streptomyces sp. NBC_00237]MCX5202788.1 C39 family peptidase [Streptomyces sp. NBC_00237]
MRTSSTTALPGTVVHPVPYFSQWASPELAEAIVTRRLPATEDPLWRAYGARSPQEYDWWSWRLCGMACLRMTLAHWNLPVPTAMELAAACVEAGAYVRRADGGLDGLIYAPFARHAEASWPLTAESRPGLPVEEIRQLLAQGRLLMLSVHPSVRELPPTDPPRRGGHLVLAVGYDAEALLVHNPSGFHGRSQEFARIPWSELHRFYAGRGVVLGGRTT